MARSPGRCLACPDMGGNVVHVVGARPNFMKAAPVIHALEARDVVQTTVHTGQHYDATMSEVFFKALHLPEPDVNLGVGSGSHSAQTAALLTGLEEAFGWLDPALVVVYGDVNSTLAGALVASKEQLPLAHVESGLRSFDPTMPEETNRRVTDMLAELLFVTSPEGLANLGSEGVSASRMHFVGNPMIDTLLANIGQFRPEAQREDLGLDQDYAAVTLHRPVNVDDPRVARRIVRALNEVARSLQVVVPLHPRGRRTLQEAGLASGDRLRVIEPLGYVDFMSLVRGARLVITDSGGIQEETSVLGVPCLTLRANTERPVTLSHGTNRLVEVDDLVDRVRDIVVHGQTRSAPEGPPLWDGHAGERIANVLTAWLGSP